MHVAVLGTGYVGLVDATCFAELGNHVTCIDIDTQKIEYLKKGIIPIYEPGLAEMVVSNHKAGRLTFTTDTAAGIQEAAIVFLAVGTPSAKDGSADLRYLFKAAEDVAKALTQPVVICTKSTVPVGTADKLRAIFKQHSKYPVELTSNPEFLREGAAVKDFLNAERVVVGLDNDAYKPLFEELYRGIVRTKRPLIFMSVRSAELTKYACNAFLATKISFVNDIAMFAEQAGANIKEVTRGMGLDSRIGSRFLAAGIGYGGSCFPKDVRALQHMMRTHGHDTAVLDAVEQVNMRQKHLLVHRAEEALGTLSGKTIAIWGLTFKPRTDDMREAASLEIIPALIKAGAQVRAYDPKGMEEAEHLLPKEVTFTKSALEAAQGANALLLLTEWDEFRTIALKEVKTVMKGTTLLDGRNIFSPADAEAAGFSYRGIGV